MSALLAFLALELLDIATTAIFLSLGGQESNPFIANGIDAWGFWGIVVMKAATAAPILGYHAWLITHGKQRTAQRTMVAACCMMLVVVAANIVTGLSLGMAPILGLALIVAVATALAVAVRKPIASEARAA